MRLGIQKDIDWRYVGALLANEGDVEQIAFLEGFVKECLSWGTKYQVELQLASVNHGLSDEYKDILSMISYKEKS